ncbi:MAG: hypothetical protein CM1200mP36_06640 [Gammaproteobacteria bacterium]|nr:MAG: hypothetical protein CM1200mP36_06640 [Gammaproteobacteria bacterium]
MASENSVELTLEVARSTEIWGDRDLLFQAISNLVDNAIKYTPEGGTICLDFCEGPSGPKLVVADSGTGVPEHEGETCIRTFLPLASPPGFDRLRFGTQLGGAVAKLHQTEIMLEDNAPGLRVVWELPRDRLA